MGARFELDPELTEELREAIVDCWVDVTNAGGAVGFTPSVTRADVRPTACTTLDRVVHGPDHLLAGFLDERLVCWLVFQSSASPVREHWVTLVRVMVHPSMQGTGLGGALLRAAERYGRTLGHEALHLTVRGGTGTEVFYARYGYREIARIPGIIRLAPDDYREEIVMLRPL